MEEQRDRWELDRYRHGLQLRRHALNSHNDPLAGRRAQIGAFLGGIVAVTAGALLLFASMAASASGGKVTTAFPTLLVDDRTKEEALVTLTGSGHFETVADAAAVDLVAYRLAMDATSACLASGVAAVTEERDLTVDFELHAPALSADQYRLTYSYQISSDGDLADLSHYRDELTSLERGCQDKHLLPVEAAYQYGLRSNPDYVVAQASGFAECLEEDPGSRKEVLTSDTIGRITFQAIERGDHIERPQCFADFPSVLEVLPTTEDIRTWGSR